MRDDRPGGHRASWPRRSHLSYARSSASRASTAFAQSATSSSCSWSRIVMKPTVRMSSSSLLSLSAGSSSADVSVRPVSACLTGEGEADDPLATASGHGELIEEFVDPLAPLGRQRGDRLGQILAVVVGCVQVILLAMSTKGPILTVCSLVRFHLSVTASVLGLGAGAGGWSRRRGGSATNEESMSSRWVKPVHERPGTTNHWARRSPGAQRPGRQHATTNSPLLAAPRFLAPRGQETADAACRTLDDTSRKGGLAANWPKCARCSS
jgi:hypothetical protein